MAEVDNQKLLIEMLSIIDETYASIQEKGIDQLYYYMMQLDFSNDVMAHVFQDIYAIGKCNFKEYKELLSLVKYCYPESVTEDNPPKCEIIRLIEKEK